MTTTVQLQFIEEEKVSHFITKWLYTKTDTHLILKENSAIFQAVMMLKCKGE